MPNQHDKDVSAGQDTIPFLMPGTSKTLENKVALVTGAAKRLGKASALALAEAGANVVITYLQSKREAEETLDEIKARGVDGMTVRCDVTEQASVRQVVKNVLERFRRLDILVNNAGNYESVEFDQLTLAQWDAIFASNVRGPFLVSRQCVEALRVTKGKIINMGSLGGLRAWATHAHYCSSKAALHMLTKAMAKALAPAIAVNCVAPGMIDLGDPNAASFMRRMAKQTPMLRNGTGEEIAAAVLFFAAAPHFITGQILCVDGGLGL